jgi:predicted nucleic acid-binding protein
MAEKSSTQPLHPLSLKLDHRLKKPRALGIASQARTDVYHCISVALVERDGCELVTADARLISSLQLTYPLIIALASVA